MLGFDIFSCFFNDKQPALTSVHKMFIFDWVCEPLSCCTLVELAGLAQNEAKPRTCAYSFFKKKLQLQYGKHKHATFVQHITLVAMPDGSKPRKVPAKKVVGEESVDMLRFLLVKIPRRNPNGSS